MPVIMRVRRRGTHRTLFGCGSQDREALPTYDDSTDTGNPSVNRIGCRTPNSVHRKSRDFAHKPYKTWRLRSVVRVLAILALAALATLGLIWVSQRRLIYFPSQAIPEPVDVALGIEEVTYATEDGLTLSAWFLPGVGEERQGTVVVFNGNAGNRADRLPLGRALADRGYAVLLVDYRGYGGNPGSPSESGLAADARAAVAYLQSRSDVDTDRLTYFGESLGAAVALGLAEERPPAALVLRSPFTSLPDIGSVHYPWLPTSLLLWDRYPNLERISGIDVPVMITAGSDDTIVPVDQSRELFAAAAGPKRLIVIDGADHNDFDLTAGEQMVNEVVEFLNERIPRNDG